MIELIEPASDKSPIDQSLKKGIKLLHICIEVPSLDAALKICSESGFRKISAVQPAVAFEMRKIVGSLTPLWSGGASWSNRVVRLLKMTSWSLDVWGDLSRDPMCYARQMNSVYRVAFSKDRITIPRLNFRAVSDFDHKDNLVVDEVRSQRDSQGTPILAQELVLNLHGIGTPHDSVSSKELFFWVSRQAFTTLLESIVATRAIAPFPTVITFDDGNASDALIALPELIKRELKASFFVCAGRIGAPHYLDRLALADLIAAGMEIGTHGKDHRNWRGLDETTLDAELGDARRRIEDVCGMAVTKAAIPFGSYDRRLLRRLRRERFECIYTSDRGLAQSEAWLKPRDTMDSTWLEADIKQVLAAKPSLKARLRRDTAMLYKRLR